MFGSTHRCFSCSGSGYVEREVRTPCQPCISKKAKSPLTPVSCPFCNVNNVRVTRERHPCSSCSGRGYR